MSPNWHPADGAVPSSHALSLLSFILDMNALMEFKESATTRETWEILGIEHFPVTLGSSKINATKELRSLREKGARVVLLSCSAIYVPQVLQQAEQLDMIKEWVWILTDEAISKVRCLIHSWFILLFRSLAEALHYPNEKFILAVWLSEVRVRALAGDTVLCSWARHF